MPNDMVPGSCRKQGSTGWISLIGFARSVNVHNSICLVYAKFNGLSCMVPGYRLLGGPKWLYSVLCTSLRKNSCNFLQWSSTILTVTHMDSNGLIGYGHPLWSSIMINGLWLMFFLGICRIIANGMEMDDHGPGGVPKDHIFRPDLQASCYSSNTSSLQNIAWKQVYSGPIVVEIGTAMFYHDVKGEINYDHWEMRIWPARSGAAATESLQHLRLPRPPSSRMISQATGLTTITTITTNRPGANFSLYS